MTTVTGTVDLDAVPIDPRIQSRRDDVAREHRARRRGWIVTIVAVAALVGGALLLTRSALLDVDTITVSGISAESPRGAEALAAAGIAAGDPLIGLDIEGAQRRIAALPWVATVQVGQTMAGDVSIDIAERTPVVMFIQPSRYVAVDINGRIVETAPRRRGLTAASLGLATTVVHREAEGAVTPTSADPAIAGKAPVSVTTVTGPPASMANLMPIDGVTFSGTAGGWIDDAALELVVAVDDLPVDLTNAAIGLDHGSLGLELHLGSGLGRVILGDTRELDAKTWAIRSFAASVDLRCMDALDVRAPTVPVLTFRTDCS